MTTPEQRAARAAYMRDWYRRHHDDARASNRRSYERAREQVLVRRRDRYAIDPAYRERLLAGKRLRPPRTVEERFWSRVTKGDGCWLWTGATDPKGYGRFWDGTSVVGAHRFAFGAVPDGLVLDHLCRTPGCVNPAHLEPVTIVENIRRGDPNGWRGRAARLAKSGPAA